jgi:hypothetical protein
MRYWNASINFPSQKQYPHTGTACEADSNDGADATGQKI